ICEKLKAAASVSLADEVLTNGQSHVPDGLEIVLCDGCDQAYHIYCASPQLNSIPKGSWFCGKCDRDLKRIKTMKRVYENLQKKVKIEDGSENTENKTLAVVDEHEGKAKSGGLDMLVTAAKTISHQETLDTLRIMNGNT
nr:PHD finger protein EHD3 isoform X1 [Tanacetum cinerariifolium]